MHVRACSEFYRSYDGDNCDEFISAFVCACVVHGVCECRCTRVRTRTSFVFFFVSSDNNELYFQIYHKTLPT